MMLRRLLLAALLLAPIEAQAQFATIGATPSNGDNSDRLATTAFVNNFFSGGLPLTSGKIFIGGAGNLAAQQTMSGDCTLSASGVITCTKTNGTAFSSLATTAPGTGVATALTVNIGSAGAPVLFNGAGGTPTSLTLTNATGLPTTGLTGTLQAAQFPALTGDITTPGASLATTLASVNSNVGTFGSTTQCPTITVNAKGLITAASQASCASGSGNVSNSGTPTNGQIAEWVSSTAIQGFSPAPITNSLASDVALSSTNTTYADGPSIAQGSTGTWWVSGQVLVTDTSATGALPFCKLWDGTTIIDSGSGNAIASTNTRVTVSLSGFLAAPAGNLRISCANQNGTTTSSMRANNTGLGKDSTISAHRLF